MTHRLIQSISEAFQMKVGDGNARLKATTFQECNAEQSIKSTNKVYKHKILNNNSNS